MTVRLREAMTEVAEASPVVWVPEGLFDRARRRRRVRVVGTALMTIVVLAGMASLAVAAVRGVVAPRPATGKEDRHPPATVGRAPRWVADLRDAPLGRVQFAFVEPDRNGKDARLIVVSGDQYRQAALGGTLSPDGRFLAYPEGQMTKLLDVSTGRIAMESEGEPITWSRKGDFIVLSRSLDTDGQTEMRVVSVPSGEIAWSFEVVPPCGAHHVSLSPDNEAVAVGCQQSGTYLYRRATGLDWHRQGRDVAGPQAWAPDGRTIVTWARYDDVYYGELFLLDVKDGHSVGTIPTANGGVAEVIAWYDGLPVVQGQDWLQPLAGDPRFLMRVESATRLLVATETIDFAESRPQGSIDAGPLLARYRALLPHVSFAVLATITLAWVLIVRRLRRRRRFR
ncbi:MAG TPA: hypothetical protein VFC19_19260 [Candidatus Limnocylindrales bacterium]|nr:hypothetical protein [Candidatus Limnocylindrales bacterium]